MQKCFFIVPLITHYRVSFFESLVESTYDFCNWTIIDGEKKVDDGRPGLNQAFSFPHRRFIEKERKFNGFTLRNYEGMLDFIRTERPKLIVLPAISGNSTYRRIASWAKANDCKLVMWCCLWEDESVQKSMLHFIKKIVFKRYIRKGDHYFTYSTHAKNILIKSQIRPDLISIAYNGLDIGETNDERSERLLADQLRRKYVGVNERLFIYVGGLGFDKKVDILLLAVERANKVYGIENIKVLIIGSGPAEEKLKKQSSGLGLSRQIHFLGRIIKNVDAYFIASDCYVLPGAGGLGLNQAMKWGKPCIVSHADGTEEDLIIPDLNGLRFYKNSVDDLAISMVQMTQKEEEFFLNCDKINQVIINNRSNTKAMNETFTNQFKRLLS